MTPKRYAISDASIIQLWGNMSYKLWKRGKTKEDWVLILVIFSLGHTINDMNKFIPQPWGCTGKN